MNELTFVVPSKIALYSAEPLLQALAARDARVFVACPRAVEPLIGALFPTLGERILVLEEIARGYRWIGLLHRLLLLAVTRDDFSQQYRMVMRRVGRHGSLFRRLAMAAADVSPKWEGARINRRLKRLLSPLLSNPFPTRRVVAVSVPSEAHLLCARGQEVVTLVESWDHPVKSPMGYPSDRVLVWCAALGEDWRAFQGDHDVVEGYPLKLRYALTRGAGPMPAGPGDRPTAMYAAAMSSNTNARQFFDDELRIIDALCRATSAAGWSLMIKPKPNGRTGDFAHFERTYPHVRAGTYREASHAADYYLDDRYNEARFDEVRSCDLVINVCTTFGLDAAVAGRPVLQLDIRGLRDFPHLAELCDNHHIRRYLLGNADLTYSPPPGTNLGEGLAAYLQEPDGRAERFSDRLRHYFVPHGSYDARLDSMVEALLGPLDAGRRR